MERKQIIFLCNGCNQFVKKSRILRHRSRCKDYQYVTCKDCKKIFGTQSARKHRFCNPQDVKPENIIIAPSANALKLYDWTKNVQNQFAMFAKENPKLEIILKQLRKFDTIPYKKEKFVNLVKSCVSLMEEDFPLIEETWDRCNRAVINPNEAKSLPPLKPAGQNNSAMIDEGEKKETKTAKWNRKRKAKKMALKLKKEMEMNAAQASVNEPMQMTD